MEVWNGERSSTSAAEDGVRFLGTSSDPALEGRFLAAFRSAYAIWCARHRKYGRGNISRHGAHGCAIRLADKLARLDQHYGGGPVSGPDTISESGPGRDGAAPDESVTDTWIDAANYGLMGLMNHLGMWDNDGA